LDLEAEAGENPPGEVARTLDTVPGLRGGVGHGAKLQDPAVHADGAVPRIVVVAGLGPLLLQFREPSLRLKAAAANSSRTL
jgi:hypothetical protein